MRYRRWILLGIQGAVLFAFWLTLSGRYEARYMVTGLLSVAVVLLLNRRLIRFNPGESRENIAKALGSASWRWLMYLLWLLWSIIVANVQVAYIVLHPRMPIAPALLRFRAPLRRITAQVVLANSITLTPGTVTVELRDGEYVVHTLLPSMAEPLVSGQMQRKVAAVFGEEAPKPPSVDWLYSVTNVER
ncbi:MAG: Na+/H+ antiporter subunit E [Chloroflexota bacterium]|nr:Na+/H+ antiporter subunit E [Chloroflexota bacterium]